MVLTCKCEILTSNLQGHYVVTSNDIATADTAVFPPIIRIVLSFPSVFKIWCKVLEIGLDIGVESCQQQVMCMNILQQQFWVCTLIAGDVFLCVY